MNKEEYQQLRETIGTREEYAEMTGNTVRTIQRREEGTYRIRVEAEIVIRLSSLIKSGPIEKLEKALDTSASKEGLENCDLLAKLRDLI